MDDLDKEMSPHGPYIPICLRRDHDLARVRDLGVYLINRSPRAILNNNSISFT